jgi:predicted nucleotidyltransferase component of viral defense system
MDEQFNRKYKKVLEILPDVAGCANGKLVLVGGTALALFHLKHRVSVDLDFVPVDGDDVELKEALKGCLTKKGYRTTPGAFKNQFVVQFEDTGIKVEVFVPERKLQHIERHVFGGVEVKAASLGDIFQMKLSAYEDRKEARDLFDIYCILKANRSGFGLLKNLLSKSGMPKNSGDIGSMAMNQDVAAGFRKVVSDVA